MLRKEPALGLLGLGLKPTTSTLSYIPEGRKEKPRLMSQEQEEVGKDQESEERKSEE